MAAKKGGKVEKVMHEFKTGSLHSGSKKGPKVKSRKQAVAIALSEKRPAKGGDAMHRNMGKDKMPSGKLPKGKKGKK